jgi:hypothetical protein
MEQVMTRLLAEMKADREEMTARLETNLKEMKAEM